jgi:hypothetical protein
VPYVDVVEMKVTDFSPFVPPLSNEVLSQSNHHKQDGSSKGWGRSPKWNETTNTNTTSTKPVYRASSPKRNSDERLTANATSLKSESAFVSPLSNKVLSGSNHHKRAIGPSNGQERSPKRNETTNTNTNSTKPAHRASSLKRNNDESLPSSEPPTIFVPPPSTKVLSESTLLLFLSELNYGNKSSPTKGPGKSSKRESAPPPAEATQGQAFDDVYHRGKKVRKINVPHASCNFYSP